MKNNLHQHAVQTSKRIKTIEFLAQLKAVAQVHELLCLYCPNPDPFDLDGFEDILEELEHFAEHHLSESDEDTINVAQSELNLLVEDIKGFDSLTVLLWKYRIDLLDCACEVDQLPRGKNRVAYKGLTLRATDRIKLGGEPRKIKSRIPFYRNLRAKRYYQGKYKDLKPGTRWVLVKEVDATNSMNTLLH